MERVQLGLVQVCIFYFFFGDGGVEDVRFNGLRVGVEGSSCQLSSLIPAEMVIILELC